MSVRFGIASGFLPALFHHLRRSDRTGSRCRAGRGSLPVALEAERRPVGARDALQAAVEQRDVRDAHVRAAASPASTAKPWFWLVISTWPVSRSCTGWFAPWWPNFIFSVVAPDGEAEQLVAEADAEHRHAARRRARGSPRSRSRTAPDRPGRSTGRRRRASARSTSRAGVCAGHDGHPAAALGEQAQDVALDAVVVGDDVEASARPPAR